MSKNNYDIKKVNQTNLILVWVFTVALSLQALSVDMTNFKNTAIATFSAAIISSISFFAAKNSKVTGFIVVGSTFLSSVILSFVKGGSIGMFVIFLLSLSMSALYFDKKLLLAFAAFIDTVLLIVFFMDYTVLTGILPVANFYSAFFGLNCTVIVLFLLVKWGSNYVDSAIVGQNNAEILSNKLGLAINEIDKAVNNLNSDLITFEEHISNTSQNSDTITTTIQEIATGVEENSRSIVDASYIVSDVNGIAKKSKAVSNSLQTTSSAMTEIVKDNKMVLSEMDSQMHTIKSSVDTAYSTVENLNTNMIEIASILSGILSISEQTNLLALNAAIESARAGEAGRGFAVVADEIRKLAEQSSSFAQKIQSIIQSTTSISQTALKEVEMGSIATSSGAEVIQKLSSSFIKLESEFNNINGNINDESKMIQSISDKFNDVSLQLEHMSSISEEHSATITSIVTSVEHLNSSITSFQSLIKEIREQGNHLSKLKEL